jgi:serine/threonine protein kinase
MPWSSSPPLAYFNDERVMRKRRGGQQEQQGFDSAEVDKRRSESEKEEGGVRTVAVEEFEDRTEKKRRGIIPGTLISESYEIGKKLGSGSFGSIYVAQDVVDGTEVAVKLEAVSSPHQLLRLENAVYSKLKGAVGIPGVWWYEENVPGITEENYNVLVMDLMGYSLESLYRSCGHHLSLKTVLMLAEQMLTRIEIVHDAGYVHRDIKPDNFMMGKNENEPVLYLIDFGLSKKYVTSSSRTHIPYRENKRLTGTPRYASVNAHNGVEQSRRDDLESLGYVLMYLLRGRLPWQGVDGSTKEAKYRRIERIKRTTSIDELCDGYPLEFKKYFQYCRLLYFEDRPDYSHLRRMFRRLFSDRGYHWDYVYDWGDETLMANNRIRRNKKKLLKQRQQNHEADGR